ncbi:hypothetical protein OIV83_000590 [Microbotryomycetes sp. JL201]|nr:hypothetical protein OIV83_000590 [Microbotryomycetes sp. JL201]
MTTDAAALRPPNVPPSDSPAHERTSSVASIKSNSSSMGPLSPALSDASSSHLSRRSSLSHNRNRSSLNAAGKTAAPAFMYMPPGTMTCQEGDDSTVDPSHPVSLARLDPTGGVCVATTAPSSSERARRMSSSSSVASGSGTVSDLTGAELVSSPPSSVGDHLPVLPPPPPVPTKQTQQVLDSLRKPSVAKERAPGEDPELAAARRALWEDEPEQPTSARLSSVFDEDEDETTQKTPTSATRIMSFDSHVAAPQAPRSEVSDYEERLEFVEPPNLDDGEEDEDRPPPSTPGHATLPPLPPCLRPKATSRRHSGTSSSGTAISVRISDEPPASFPTYSPIDYERKGDEPVSRLSVREWLELQGVREAVGVWSGRIEKPDEQTLTRMESKAANGDDAGDTDSKESALAKPNGYTSLSGSVSSLSSQQDVSSMRSCGGLAAMVGVVTVGHNATPVTAPKSLFD